MKSLWVMGPGVEVVGKVVYVQKAASRHDSQGETATEALTPGTPCQTPGI